MPPSSSASSIVSPLYTSLTQQAEHDGSRGAILLEIHAETLLNATVVED